MRRVLPAALKSMRKVELSLPDLAPLFRHGGWPRAARSVLDFSVSVNPWGPAASVLRALRSIFDERGSRVSPLTSYPEPHSETLAERLAAHHGLDTSEVVVGNGSTELIHAIPRAFRSKRAAIAEPTFTEYLSASRLAGASVDHWLPEAPSFEPGPFPPGETDLVWLCNPNNPTGQLWPQDVLASWIGDHPATLFVVDEAFLPFHHDEDEHSLVGEVRRHRNLIVVRSLTKIHALPGLRLGYAVSSPENVARILGRLPPWSVNGVAQVAGLAALNDPDFLRTARGRIDEQRDRLLTDLRGLSPHLRVLPAETNFLLLRLKTMPAGQLARRLAERGIVIRDASNFVGLDNHYVRIAVRKPDENDRLIQELGAIFGEAEGRP